MTLGVDRRLRISVATMEDSVQKKLKQAITVRLAETREHVEKELPEYIMSMIINKKSKNYMHKNLEAFIGEDASIFCDWVFDLVEKINDTSIPDIPRSSESEGDIADSGSYPANIIKNVREEKEKEARSKPSSSGHHRESEHSKTDDSRKRKVEEERKARVPIEAPRRDSRKISSRKDSDRGRERISERERERDRDRHRVIRKDKDRHRARSVSPWKKTSSSHVSRRTSEKKPIRYESTSEEHDDDEDMPQSTVASKVVAARREEKAPTVSSQVTVKRHVRKMGDEKLMKARSSMFMKALTDASHSASGEPSTKAARIVEKMDSGSDSKAPRKSIEERIVRVRIDVSKPPTKRMEERLRKIKEQKEAGKDEAKGKRKHEEIVYDLPEDAPVEESLEDDRIYLDDEEEDEVDEGEIDRILEETRDEIETEQPPTKRRPNSEDHVDNAEEDIDMAQMKKKVRCSFWPRCSRGESCLYLHPNAVCANFPSCSFGQKCHYIHPPCKFTHKCLNKQCAYTHGDPEVMGMLAHYFPAHMLPKPKPGHLEKFHVSLEPDVPLAAPSSSNKRPGVLCRYADSCLNPNCVYDHPKLCRFAEQCINERCAFYHPPAPLPKSAMKKTNPSMYKWSAPKS